MKNRINIGIIGCGMFARTIHIPNLKANPRFRIAATADVDSKAAEQAGELTGADYSCADADELLRDGGIDAVLITTRHDSHADLTVRAARSGKHVLCEKPMGLDISECRQVAQAVKQNNVCYTVGYNRGLAPMVARAGELLSGLNEKKMIYHRMQNPVPPDHWLLDPSAGGGRITGEGCHVFDMLCALAGSEPVSVYASGGSFVPGGPDPSDSSAAVIKFADGSVGSALLMSRGCPSFPKEATEIYAGGRAIYINDFREMEYFGFEGRKSVKVSFDSQDKGHARELELFAAAVLNGQPPPNGPENAARAAIIGFKAAESIRTGKPQEIEENDYSF